MFMWVPFGFGILAVVPELRPIHVRSHSCIMGPFRHFSIYSTSSTRTRQVGLPTGASVPVVESQSNIFYRYFGIILGIFCAIGISDLCIRL